MQVLDRVAAHPLGPNATLAFKKVPGCGIPVCAIQSTIAQTLITSPTHNKNGRKNAISESFSFDSSAVLYGRLVYNKLPSGLRSASIVISAEDERGYNLHGKRFRHTCHDHTKKEKCQVGVELFQLSLSNFLRLAARRAGLNSISEAKILSSTRPRTVILLCNNLESIHDFELQNAIPFDLRVHKHVQMSMATTANYLPTFAARSQPKVLSDAQKKKLVGRFPGEESPMIRIVPDHHVESKKVTLAFEILK